MISILQPDPVTESEEYRMCPNDGYYLVDKVIGNRELWLCGASCKFLATIRPTRLGRYAVLLHIWLATRRKKSFRVGFGSPILNSSFEMLNPLVFSAPSSLTSKLRTNLKYEDVSRTRAQELVSRESVSIRRDAYSVYRTRLRTVGHWSEESVAMAALLIRSFRW